MATSTVVGVELDTIREVVDLYRHALTQLKAYEEDAAKWRGVIEATMGDAENGTIDGCLAVRWPHIKSNRLDQTLLKSLHPEIYAECQTASTSRRFSMVND